MQGMAQLVFLGDNGLATDAELSMTSGGGIAIDNYGNLYIADVDNHRVRKVDATTKIITTIAGNAGTTYSGDGGAATLASLGNISYLCVDVFGNLYLPDNLNFKLRKVTPSGIITAIAGTGTAGFSGDGAQASAAQLHGTYGLCTDAVGNIYLPDNGRIRKINISTGVINTIAGTGGYGFVGDGSLAVNAEFALAQDVTVDAAGTIYISDVDNNRIREINSAGIITTVVGTGIGAYIGDGSPAITAEINSPRGIALDTCGNLFIADNGNKRIRKVEFNPTCKPLSISPVGANERISIYPNPAISNLTISAPLTITSIEIVNVLGQRVLVKNECNIDKMEININYLPAGVYVVKVNDTYVQKLIKE